MQYNSSVRQVEARNMIEESVHPIAGNIRMADHLLKCPMLLSTLSVTLLLHWVSIRQIH